MKAISLFTGCGGSDLGFIQAGGHIIMANDILPYARDFYLSNLPKTDYKLGDIRGLEKFPQSDILIGCYPCQGFSQGGKRDPTAGINNLYLEFCRVLRLTKPKAFIVENVSGMRRADIRYVFQDQIKSFENSGYEVKYSLLSGLDFGLAQNRKRIFIIGIRKDLKLYYEFPSITHSSIDNNLKPYTTIRQALHGLPEWPEKKNYYDLPFHWYYLSRNRYCGWDGQSKTIVANARHIPLHPVSPKLTKIKPDVWQFIDDSPARRFSFQECARLQGFPSDFIFPEGGLMEKYKVIGNAVPPVLFKVISQKLINLLA